MNVLQKIASVLSSPAKPTPAISSPAKKRGHGDGSTMPSDEKRERGSYDPREYENAVYDSAKNMTVTEETQEEEEEEEEEQATEQLLQEQLRAEDERRHARPTATRKSVRRPNRALSDALETETSGTSRTAFNATLASNDMLAAAEALLVKEVDGAAKRKKLMAIEQARAKNDAIMAKAEGKGYLRAQRQAEKGKVKHAAVTRAAVGHVAVLSANSGRESEEEKVMEEEVDDNVEIDWSEEERIILPPTPQRRLYTVHEEPTSTTVEAEVDRLKYTPVTKQPRTHLNSSATNYSTTKLTSHSTSTTALNQRINASRATSPSHPANFVNSPTTIRAYRLPKDMSYPPGWSSMTPDQKWLTDPNLRARDLDSNPQRIRAELSDEPEYAFRDAEIRDGIWSLTSGIETFGKTFFPRGADAAYITTAENGDVMVKKEFFEGLSKETVRVVACIASGGPGGVWGWHDLFVDREKIQALVCGIVGNVLSEQVFRHAFFGGTEEGIRVVRAVEAKHRNDDGFDRKTLYASTIRAHLPSPTCLPDNFTTHVNIIVTALYTHLSPLLHLVNTPTTTPSLSQLFPHLHNLTTAAALLSLAMALDPHTVYHHVPLFKEDNYTPSTMDCFNDATMRQRNMRTPSSSSGLAPEEQSRREKLTEQEIRRARGDTALTQIVCLEGVTAYRKGGWEAGVSEVNDSVFDKEEYAGMGVRARILSHGWTYCRWGRARSMRGSAQLDGDAARRVHGDVWREGGFVDFTGVEGVVDWLGVERVERDEKKKIEKKNGVDKVKVKAKARIVQSTYLEALGDPDL